MRYHLDVRLEGDRRDNRDKFDALATELLAAVTLDEAAAGVTRTPANI